uniref:Small ribosomal subunit protein uS3c n=1 Tax=Xylochloris irregularis TaxID=480381 RepID=A0A097KMD9_9CHLO|nr:ribosomal protein S3 [Xylochloris irregularis]AIT94349.1 ribosomal protein S3 [Xylochloris irregularis]
MGQKIHPLGFRLGITRNYRSQWFSHSTHYPQLLMEDSLIRKVVTKTFPEAKIAEIHIKRCLRVEGARDQTLFQMGLQNLESLIVRIRAQHPEKILGIDFRQRVGVRRCRKLLKEQLQRVRQEYVKRHNYFKKEMVQPVSENQHINIYVSKVFLPDVEASSIANFLVEKFESRKRVRADVKQIIKEFKKDLKEKRWALLRGREHIYTKRCGVAPYSFRHKLARSRRFYRKAKTLFERTGLHLTSLSPLPNNDQDPEIMRPLKRMGVKIQISGRLNGAEIARSLWARKGRVPLQTLNADIDYSYKTARTIYGLIGIKVWVFRQEKKPRLRGEVFFSPSTENPLLLPPNLHDRVRDLMRLKLETFF